MVILLLLLHSTADESFVLLGSLVPLGLWADICCNKLLDNSPEALLSFPALLFACSCCCWEAGVCFFFCTLEPIGPRLEDLPLVVEMDMSFISAEADETEV